MVELYDVSLDHINIYLGILLPIADKINKTTRLDKIHYPNYNINFIKNKLYIDFHMPRPYIQYKNFIDNIINLL